MSQIRRRQFLAAAGAALALPLARAQSSRGSRRLGYFLNAPKPSPENVVAQGIWAAWREKLASLGWIVGKNLEWVSRYSGGDSTRLPEIVAELVRERVDVIFVTSTAAAVAAARGTKSIPIVLAGASAYPIDCGLIKSFARPGTNVTGVAYFQGIEIHSKLVQFLREIAPAAKKLAWIAFPADLVTVSGGEFSPKPYYAKVAQSVGLDFVYHECREPQDIEPAFTSIRNWGAHGVILEPAILSYVEAATIARLAKLARLPTFYTITHNVVEGGLLAYSPVHKDLHDQALAYVDRIFRGARAAELPVSMPDKLELSVNLQTAKALGLTIPQSILFRADRIIE